MPQEQMQLYHAYIAGKHPLDRMDFFLIERQPKDELRKILHHLGLGNIRQLIREQVLSLSEAEQLCIIASKLLTWPQVEALQHYTERAMGIASTQFNIEEVKPPLDKSALGDVGLQLAIQAYHEDGLFLPLWANPYYDIPIKIGGFVPKEAQFILQNRAEQLDDQFANFVQQADTLDQLLGDEPGG